MRRLIAILVIALLAAPGTWLRTPHPPVIQRASQDGWNLALQPLRIVAPDIGEARIAGAWALSSDYPGFGGYSALVALGDGTLFAASDTGRMLAFAPPGSAPILPQMGRFANRWEPSKFLVDIEGMTRDPESGRIWIAYEGSNVIERFEPSLTGAKQARPEAMRDWPSNTGPETLLRLSDGRFLVISESHGGVFGGSHRALLFPYDPVEGADPIPFVFESREGFRPVDAAQLPDGRVALLLREFEWMPPSFKTRVVVADPAGIREGETWTGRQIAAITGPGLTENYEGLEVESLPDGTVRLWLISDDNRSLFQRTQLIELRWKPDK